MATITMWGIANLTQDLTRQAGRDRHTWMLRTVSVTAARATVELTARVDEEATRLRDALTNMSELRATLLDGIADGTLTISPETDK